MYIYVCMYVCMYVCTYVCIYMYVCMYVCMYLSMAVFIFSFFSVCTAYMYIQYMYACMYVLQYICMFDVCVTSWQYAGIHLFILPCKCSSQLHSCKCFKVIVVSICRSFVVEQSLVTAQNIKLTESLDVAGSANVENSLTIGSGFALTPGGNTSQDLKYIVVVDSSSGSSSR